MSGARGKLIVYMCSLIESRNYAAENHCEQIKKFTEIMLEKVRQFCPEYELDEKKCEHIILASPTHDIGKISISDKILNKPGRLTNDEFMVMKNHTLKGKHIFENMLRDLGYENTYVGTVEGFPGLDYVIRRMKIRGIRKVHLMPLMIVAGDHARNDLAGAEEDSWNSLLQAEGFETDIVLKGMGEIDGIAQIFVEHLEAAEQI